MVKGQRELLTCPACSKRFFYWMLESAPHPKVKCYYCGTESFPKGEPPAAPAPAPAAATPTPAPSKGPDGAPPAA